MRPQLSTNALNYALYQTGWLATVGAAMLCVPVAGMAVATVLVAVHLRLASEPRAELRLVLLGGALGLVVDSLQVATGLLSFPTGSAVAWLCPPWIVMMWMQFATTFRYSLRRFVSHPVRAAIAGAVGGPLAYLGGERLGAVHLHEPRVLTLVVMSVLWLAAVPLLARGVEMSEPGRYLRWTRGTARPGAAGR